MSGTTPIVLDKAEFPYLVAQENTPIRSLIEITRTRDSEEYFGSERTLFYIANAELSVASDGRQNIIKVHHTFARDDEDDRSKIGWFEFAMIQFVGGYGDQLNFKGLLTLVSFYPDAKGVENPFAGAVEKKGRTEYGYSKNTGYPYTPPNVTIPDFVLPTVVEFSFHTGTDPERTAKWLKKAMASHKKARLRREREARQREKERIAEEKARQERRNRITAWLTTDEGKEYKALRAEMCAIPTHAKRMTWLEKTTPGKRYDALQERMEVVGAGEEA